MGNVRLYGERGRGGGKIETGTTKDLTRDQEWRQKMSGLKIEGRNPETRINPVSKKKHICQTTPVDASRNSRTIAGSAVSYAPHPTPKPSTTRRTGWKQTCIRGDGTQERSLVDSPPVESAGGVRRRSLPEDSAGGVRRMDDG